MSSKVRQQEIINYFAFLMSFFTTIWGFATMVVSIVKDEWWYVLPCYVSFITSLFVIIKMIEELNKKEKKVKKK